MDFSHYRYRYILAVGSNLGDRESACRDGLQQLLLATSSLLLGQSPQIETAALVLPGSPPQPPYINAVAEIASDTDPDQLYHAISLIEDRYGHDRTRKFQPRGLDIDILRWAENTHGTFAACRQLRRDAGHAGLQIPHPALGERAFLAELLKHLG